VCIGFVEEVVPALSPVGGLLKEILGFGESDAYAPVGGFLIP
jgi:hypothetical protein